MSATPDGTAATTHQTFSRTTRIAETINADTATVWRLLTTAATYPDWNSTIVSLDGTISPGSKIKLVSALNPNRSFTLKIKEFTPTARLAWGDALGNRLYSLPETGDGQTRFEMVDATGARCSRSSRTNPVIRCQLRPVHR